MEPAKGRIMIRNIAAVISVLMSLAGCSVTLPVIALSGDGPEVFSGTATGGMDGRGTLNLIGTRSGLLCYGAFTYTRATGGAGAKGQGDAECEDGRQVRFEFFARSLNVGSGSGVDNRDKPFFFTYGMTDAETMAAFSKRFPAHAPAAAPTAPDPKKDDVKRLEV